jgi:hypothetical protein
LFLFAHVLFFVSRRNAQLADNVTWWKSNDEFARRWDKLALQCAATSPARETDAAATMMPSLNEQKVRCSFILFASLVLVCSCSFLCFSHSR